MVYCLTVAELWGEAWFEAEEVPQPVRHAAVEEGGQLGVRNLKGIFSANCRLNYWEFDSARRALEVEKFDVVGARLDGVLRDPVVPGDREPVASACHSHVKQAPLISIGALVPGCSEQFTRYKPILNLANASRREAVRSNGGDEHRGPLEAFGFVDCCEVDCVEGQVNLAVESLVSSLRVVNNVDTEVAVVPVTPVLPAHL